MPEDRIASEVCRQWNKADSDAATTMALYQEVADHCFERENWITKTSGAGEDKSKDIIDPSGRLALQDMVAGVFSSFVPVGSLFFRLLAQEPQINDIGRVASYLNRLTALVHQEMMRSNFMTEFSEWLYSLIAFGTGNIYSGWDWERMRLLFRDWDVGNFRFGVDAYGYPSWCLIKWQYTAEQAYEEFGDDAGEQVVKFAKDVDKSSEKFTFIWRVQKRKNRDTTKDNNLNWTWEEVCVNEKEKKVVKESGYRRFPYHISRWTLTSQETWGRGQGTIALTASKMLQAQNRDMLLAAALANKPPMEVLAEFEGKPNIAPGGRNNVYQAGTIKAIDRGLQGNFPITLDMVNRTQELIDKCFFRHVFAPLENLTGDRRTTLEIQERTKEGLIRLISPVSRIQNEGLAGLIENCAMLCIENYLIEPPPPELNVIKIDYLGRLAKALQEQQVDAFMRYANFSIQMDAIEPGFTKKSINLKRAGRRMATTFGMNEGDLNTEEEIAAIEQQEAAAQQAQQMAMAAETMGKAYKNTSTAAEEGSPAEALMSQV